MKHLLTPILRGAPRGLKTLFVGLNPSRFSVENGYHFSSESPFFYFLNEAGITPQEIAPGFARTELISLDIGLTDLFPDLDYTKQEETAAEVRRRGEGYLRSCQDELHRAIQKCTPRVVVFLGRLGPSLYYSSSEKKFGFGILQQELLIDNPRPIVFVARFPTGRPNYEQLILENYEMLRALINSISYP